MMKYIRAIFKLGWYVIYCYFAWMIKYSRHPEKYPLEVRFKKVQILIRKALKALNVTLEEEGVKDILSGPAGKVGKFLVCNHTSLTDPLYFIAISEKPITFVCKKEVRKLPFVGRIVKIIEGVFLDREDLKAELKTFLEVSKALKEKPELNWLVYAEGTRNKGDLRSVLEFKHGTFKFPMKAESDIVVCSCVGAYRVISTKIKGKYQIVNLKMDKVFKKEEYDDYSTNELAKLCQTYCLDGVKEMFDTNEKRFKELNTKKKKA